MVRAHGKEYRQKHRLSAAEEKVLRHVSSCRTAALGGHLDLCYQCGHQRISYNSCRDRHCPKCQSLARADWLEERLARLLPVPYFHVVFTLPEEINPLALGNKKLVYGILFAVAAATLKAIAADPKHLGAQIGLTAVLHTWGQNLLFHPHLHCVVTGGGLSADGGRWVAGRKHYFLPVKVLGRLFRGKFLDALHRAWQKGHLRLSGSSAELANPATWGAFKDSLYRKPWVVYAKPPFGGPEHVFRYLGRYTHRVAIANHRLVDISNGRVTFTVKDYSDGCQRKLLCLEAVEFLRRFLLHVLPKGLVRIRHYGLQAGRNIATKLEAAFHLLEPEAEAPPKEALPTKSQPWWVRLLERTGLDLMACPACGIGRLRRCLRVPPLLAQPP